MTARIFLILRKARGHRPRLQWLLRMSYLFHNLLHFSRLLHAAGLDVHAGRMPDVAAALSEIDIGRRSDFYFTLRTLLIHRHQDLGPFDDAFRVFWRR